MSTKSIIILLGSSIIVVEIAFLFIYNSQTFLALSTGLFFFLMSSFITFIKYKRLVVGKDFSPIVFLAAVLIIIITSITFNVDNSSFLFLPTDEALTLANLFNSFWILRNYYDYYIVEKERKKDKEFSSYQRLFQVWILLSLSAIYSFVSSPVIPVIGLLSISMFLSAFKSSTILQVLEEIPKPPQKNKTSFNSNIDIKK